MLEVHQRRGVLAGRNRNAALFADRRQTRIVFRWPHRLFNPAQIQWAKFLGHIQRFTHAPRGVDVEGNFHAGTCGLARRTDHVDVDLMQLEVFETGVDRALHIDAHELGVGVADQACIRRQRRDLAAAQQLVDRLTGRFARDIPQRDVDRRQAIDECATATEDVKLLLQIALQFFAAADIGADQFRCQDGVDHDFHGRYRREAEGFAPAHDAVIGGDFDHQRVDHLQVFRAPDAAG